MSITFPIQGIWVHVCWIVLSRRSFFVVPDYQTVCIIAFWVILGLNASNMLPNIIAEFSFQILSADESSYSSHTCCHDMITSIHSAAVGVDIVGLQLPGVPIWGLRGAPKLDSHWNPPIWLPIPPHSEVHDLVPVPKDERRHAFYRRYFAGCGYLGSGRFLRSPGELCRQSDVLMDREQSLVCCLPSWWVYRGCKFHTGLCQWNMPIEISSSLLL